MIINPYIYGVATSYDADAQLFFNAQTTAGVTLTTTQMNAVNQWVVDAKAIGIWTKFKAIYPMVGGTATSHKFNLKNANNSDSAFRLIFNGGWTHSSNGALPGINGYADTKLNPSLNLINNNTHLSYYSRTNISGVQIDMGVNNSSNQRLMLSLNYSGNLLSEQYFYTTGRITAANSNSLGLYIGTRTTSTIHKAYKNGFQIGTTDTSTNSINISSINLNLYLSGFNNNGSFNSVSTKECAFSSIGDGLTDLESQLFYQITEKYQVALGRNINALQSFYYNPAYNNETNAFLFSTQITDNTIQTATNTLVSDLKTAGVFTKMKAIYPMVGGTATTHKFNLVNAQDSTAAFALSFIGGWTHSSNGIQGNGTNNLADTFLTPSTSLSLNSTHISIYSRTNNFNAILNTVDIGAQDTTVNNIGLFLRDNLDILNLRINEGFTASIGTNTNSACFFVGSRTASNVKKSFINGNLIYNNTTTSTALTTTKIGIGASYYNNNSALSNYFSNRQYAFCSIGNGLTDADALNLYIAVQNFQTTLGRQV